MKKKYEKSGTAEEYIKQELEAEKWKVVRIFVEKGPFESGRKAYDSNYLEVLELCEGVLGIGEGTELPSNLYKLRYEQDFFLHDYICSKDKKLKFVEVKCRKKMDMPKKQQEGLGKIREWSYRIEIYNVEEKEGVYSIDNVYVFSEGTRNI